MSKKLFLPIMIGDITMPRDIGAHAHTVRGTPPKYTIPAIRAYSL